MATISIPNPAPSAIEDAEKLRKAFQGWGTDEMTMIDVLAHRNAAQRKQIKIVYEEQYEEKLLKRIESEISGHFERAVYLWIFDPVERQAIMANIAIESKVFDFPVIIEIACVNSPNELLAVKQVYQSLYKRSLEEDVASHTTGDFCKLLFALVGTYRYDGEEINTELANTEAKILNDAITKGQFNDNEIIRILSTRSKAQLNTTFNCYKDAQNRSITKALSTETPNDFAIVLRAAIRCMNNPKKYFDKVFRRTLQKSGTDEDTLTRLVLTHAEKDLKEIKELFQTRTNMTLEQAVAKKTSGDYKNFLLALIGN
ncbi:annexin-like protein RJ4 [Carex littledalei]|uniref:Annexin-like protein RJ4 n=1 Tax=Carex littledalei TaxID=544730 RepID=A0A833QZJ7_9POAL|nr:annexin-like protein RJ4 [Carex littledalei]